MGTVLAERGSVEGPQTPLIDRPPFAATAVSWSRVVAVWLLIIAAETVHGVLRTLFLQPAVGDFHARQIGVFSGAAIIVGIAYLMSEWLRVTATRLLIGIGLAWAALTLLFEVVLGRLVLALSWDRILSDFDLSQGGLLLLGYAVLIFSPLIAARLRARRVLP